MSVEWKAAQVEFAIDPVAYAFEEAITRRSDTVWQDACLFVGATSRGIVWNSTGLIEAVAFKDRRKYTVKIDAGLLISFVTEADGFGDSFASQPHMPRKVGKDVW